ncbi:hypothetical protein ACFVT5_03855 [Streptomyces sp. NPDC058001]|uniref:hypothetical protein n=1 Tax=Streptomyces sp. NPDC058001 TaxID=3346300 RepID=UPI0036EE1202
MTASGYPHLGFDPVPGNTDTVRELRRKLSAAAEVLEDTHGLVTRLTQGSHWKGDAAVAFREQLDGGPLPLNLRNAARSIRGAAKQLHRWEDELADFQRRAGRLEEAADAGGAVGEPSADGEGDDVRRRARRLAEEHEERAAYRARKIRGATRRLAPQEPGFLDTALDWLTENLPDILSWAAAVVGLAALFVVTGGTAAAVLLLLAAALSAGAAGLRLSDPLVRASLWDGVSKGELDGDFWSNLIGLAADGLGVVPGIGAVSKGSVGTLRAVGASGEAVTLGRRAGTFADETLTAAKELSDARNPFMEWVVVRAPRLTGTAEATEAAAPWAGAATATYGVASTLFEPLESDTVAEVGTAIDGTFLAPVDGAETVDLIRRLLQ